ncbi:MAG: VWA domain-containing protein [bacterium]|nr:VWA domain-containing protein [bacterium]
MSVRHDVPRSRLSKPRTTLAAGLLGLVALPFAVLAESFVKVPGTAVIKKVVAASDNIHATSTKDGSDEAFQLEVLRPYFVLAEVDGMVKITDQQATGGRVGFVRAKQAIEWNSREGLHFQPSVLSFDERPEVKVWKDRATIEQYANTGNIKSYGPSYAEEKLISRALPKELVPYPILDSSLIPTVTGSDKRIYQVLIPAYVPTATVETDLTDDEIREVLSNVTFCVVFDATGSMAPYANEMAATIETLLRSMGAQAGDVRVGFVFYRDIDDGTPVEIVKATTIDVAVKRLREMASKMTGGGDEAEPVLDAAVIAASQFNWASGFGQSGSHRAAIVVANADAKPTTVGLDGRVGRGQNAAEVASLLASQFIHVYALQAGSEDGGSLKITLGKLANDTGGEFYPHDSVGISRSFPTHIKRLMEGTTKRVAKTAEAIADTAIPGDRDYTVLPLKVLDSELINRLQEAAKEFNITEGGLVIREGWMFEQDDLYQEQVLVEKETIEQLITFFSLLSDSSVSCDDLRSGVRENLKAMLGEDIDHRAELQELIEKKLGIHFRTTLMGFSLEYLCGLSPRERLQLQKRIGEAGGKLSSFLEVATADFHKAPQAWMKLSYLP